MSSEMRVRNRISPIQMNNGSAVSAQLVLAPHTVVAIRLPGGESVKSAIATQATPSRLSAIQTPAIRKAASAASSTTEMTHGSMDQRSNPGAAPALRVSAIS